MYFQIFEGELCLDIKARRESNNFIFDSNPSVQGLK